MDNVFEILMDLNVFENCPVAPIPQSLEDYLQHVSKTGNTVFPWPKIKPLFKLKLETTINEFNETLPCEPGVTKMPNVETFKYTEMKERMVEQLESYSGVPFTVQRLCELLCQPTRHYKRVDKFMRGLEKVMLVVTTVEPGTGTSTSQATLERNGSTGATPLLPPALGHLQPKSNINVQENILKDSVRMQAYKEAILQNQAAFKDKVVLDVCCGTGILSLFAAAAGAKKIIAVDDNSFLEFTEKIVEDNKLENVISVVLADIRELDEIPGDVEKVDIILCDWIGDRLLNESNFDCLMYARDRWLVEGGLIFPDLAGIYVTAMEDTERIES